MPWYQTSIWPMGLLTCAARIFSLILAGVKRDYRKTIQVNRLMTRTKCSRGQRDSDYRCCSWGLWNKNYMQTKISGRRIIIYKTLCQDFSISFYCLLTITLEKPKQPLIVCPLRHHQILSAVSLLSLNFSPPEGHIPAAGSTCFVPALATPPAYPASRPAGPKLNCKLLLHSALVLASPFFYALDNLCIFINTYIIY